MMIIPIMQRHDWDCGVCCIAMALDLSWEDAIAVLMYTKWKGGKTYGIHLAKATGGSLVNSREYSGSLERCIVQVSDNPDKITSHWIWMDKGIHCPAGHYNTWAHIKSIGQIVNCNKKE